MRMTVSVCIALLLGSLSLAAAGCNPNLIGAPCTQDDHRPTDQYCHLAAQKCAQGSRTGTNGGTAQDGGTTQDGGIDTDPRVSLLSPIGVTAASRPELDWSDSRVNQARYAVQLATTYDFTSPLIDQVGLTESHLALATALAAGTTYHWRVAIEDGAYRWNWSAPATFTIDLGAVTLGWPSGTIANSQPTLTWGASALAGATYNVQIASDRDVGTIRRRASRGRPTLTPPPTRSPTGPRPTSQVPRWCLG